MKIKPRPKSNRKSKPFWWLIPEPPKPLKGLAQLNKHNHKLTKGRREFVARMEAK